MRGQSWWVLVFTVLGDQEDLAPRGCPLSRGGQSPLGFTFCGGLPHPVPTSSGSGLTQHPACSYLGWI